MDPELEDSIGQLRHTGFCVQPVRIARGVELTLACKDRRAAVCPACSALYAGDAWRIVATGMHGGKGVPVDVGTHPFVYATLTAPSFGAVHSGSGPSGMCHPRRAAPLCRHGASLDCRERHGDGDAPVGQALCARCYDYTGAVLWNAAVGRLWHWTRAALVSTLARSGGRSVREVRATSRVSYVKVAEFQKRGLVHFHLVLRADGKAEPYGRPPGWLSGPVLAGALEAATKSTSVGIPDIGDGEIRESRWGTELDVRCLDDTEGAAIASYIAKYAVKAADASGELARRIRSDVEIERLDVTDHVAAMVRTAWALGELPDLAALRLRAHAHALGYRGHFATKSQGWSVSFGELHERRAAFRRRGAKRDTTGGWSYKGRGYGSERADRLAAELARATTPKAGGLRHKGSTRS